MHVNGVLYYQDDVVYDSNYVPAEGCSCYDDALHTCDNRRANGTRGPMRRGEWVDKMRQRLGKSPAKRGSARRANTNGRHTLYEADSWLYSGVATTYSSSGKLIGTGPFEYSLPCVYDSGGFEPLEPNEAGDRKVHKAYTVQTGVHSIKGYHSS